MCQNKTISRRNLTLTLDHLFHSLQAVAARALTILPLRTRAALTPEAIAPRQFVQTLVPPLVATVGVASAVACWRIGVVGHIPKIVFVVSAVAIGVAVFCALVFGLMPNTVARLPKPNNKTAPHRSHCRINSAYR